VGLLVVSLLALAAGPFLVLLIGRTRATAVLIDSFVLVVVGGLVILHVLPQSLSIGGWPTLVAVGVGVLIPVLAERGLRTEHSGRALILALAFAGLALHSMIDGVALAGGGSEDPRLAHAHDVAAWAVIAHQIPVGISIWWIVSRTLGAGNAISMLAISMLGTVAGFVLGGQALSGASATSIALFQALLSGSLLHVVLHDHVPAPRDAAPRWHLPSIAGLLAAVAVLVAVGGGHEHDHAHGATAAGHGAGELFVLLALETAPVLLLAYLAVGFAQVFLPRGWIDRINRGSPLAQALRGVAVGLPLPVCSCGVVPIYRGLIAKGASIAAAIAFLIATPELEIAAILLTFQLMGAELAVARLVSAALLALAVGALLGAFAERRSLPAPACAALDDPPQGARARIGAALRAGLGEAVDHTAAWILVGLGLSAILLPHVGPATFAALPAGLDVPLAALLGLPIYVCASGSTPLAAVLVYQGLSPGAALAFLLTGPATNVTTFAVLTRLHGRRLAAMFVVAMLVLATALGYATNLAFGSVRVPLALDRAHGGASLFQAVCLALLALLVLGSLARKGTRGFIGALFLPPTREVEDEHAHAQPRAEAEVALPIRE
jgi:hypothetical protein